MKTAFVAFISLGLAACAQQPALWAKPGGSRDDFNRDKYACVQEAQQHVSGAYVNRYGGTSSSGMVTNQNLFGVCMNARGWYLTQGQLAGQSPAPEGQLPLDPVAEASRTSNEEGKARCTRSEFQIYFAKSSCNAFDMTLEQLADKSKITEVEKTVFSKFRIEAQATSNKRNSAYRMYGGQKGAAVASVSERFDQAVEKAALDLYDGKITWGDYNRTRKDVSTQMREEMGRLR